MNERTALQLVLDSVDYMAGNCSPTDMVAAALPGEIILMARKALSDNSPEADVPVAKVRCHQ